MTFLWVSPLQLLSLDLTTPQYKMNYVLCQGMDSGKGSRREELCPVLCRQFILKYMAVPVLMKALSFSREKTMDVDPVSCGWAC